MIAKQILALVLSGSLSVATLPGQTNQPSQPEVPTSLQVVKQSPQELQQLVAPIALYPDALVAQILAAATYPTEIVEADRWMQQHPNLKGKQLADAVNQQPWDPSVKALTQFPSVLANMDRNLSWTSSLGDAYVNQAQDVMNAIQVMRADAKRAGQLKNNAQEKVITRGSTIAIEPANPDVVYVPQYDPWIVYGFPIAAWPGWYAYPGLYIATPGIAFGIGFSLGFFGGFAWGWPHWGFDWAHRTVIFNHTTYISHSTTIVNRNRFVSHNTFVHNNFANHNNFDHGTPHYAVPQGAFHDFNRGGITRGYSFRGRSSLGGGSHGAMAFHGGMASHGGGGRR